MLSNLPIVMELTGLRFKQQTSESRTYSPNDYSILSFTFLFLLILFPQSGIFHLPHFNEYLLYVPGTGPGNGVSIEKKRERFPFLTRLISNSRYR